MNIKRAHIVLSCINVQPYFSQPVGQLNSSRQGFNSLTCTPGQGDFFVIIIIIVIANKQPFEEARP